MKPYNADPDCLADPATPDDSIHLRRLEGRLAFRRGKPADTCPHEGLARTRWFLGWYDERLKRFYTSTFGVNVKREDAICVGI